MGFIAELCHRLDLPPPGEHTQFWEDELPAECHTVGRLVAYLDELLSENRAEVRRLLISIILNTFEARIPFDTESSLLPHWERFAEFIRLHGLQRHEVLEYWCAWDTPEDGDPFHVSPWARELWDGP